MPFTVSHAVVALPALRGPLPAAAVAAGAMAPDVPLFLPGGLSYADTHAFPSLLVTALPMAAVLLAVWALLLRPAAGILLPRAIAARLPAAWAVRPRPTTRGVLLALAALLLGVLSHVVWDAFTHEGRVGSALLPALAAPWGALPGYRWIQYASSVGGVLALLVAGALEMRRVEPRAVPRAGEGRALRIILASAVVAIAAGAALVPVASHGLPRDLATLRGIAYDAITGGGAALAVAVLIAALAAAALRRFGRRPAA
ncbi:hypothetical protein ABID70_000474 [Clavibacter michiganensis]|uniref:DUF4184 family protein n=1 Tax=Clavibacter michiganensis TaxID=28447 RepID=UPI001AE38503|nr:DUF4184 family protein [Clavibacter michiganensis]MBP2457910.1 hypothetical protein [Clavibacter michiganensis]MDQ0410480.1 hypothetical protein [Clavibacter michiganensis]